MRRACSRDSSFITWSAKLYEGQKDSVVANGERNGNGYFCAPSHCTRRLSSCINQRFGQQSKPRAQWTRAARPGNQLSVGPEWGGQDTMVSDMSNGVSISMIENEGCFCDL